MNKKKTAVEVYLSIVFKWGLIIMVCACMCATVIFNAEKLFGLYPTVPWTATLLFGLMDILFFTVALYLVKTSYDEHGFLKNGRLKTGKLFVTGVLIIQWNFILYMIPSRTFWGFLFFFLIFMAFFLDLRMLLFSSIACLASLFIAWGIRGSMLLPAKDELFLTDTLLCIVALVLSIAGLVIFVFFMSNFLVNAKKDELEENNQRVQNVLDRAMSITEKLGDASGVLLSSSQSESASTEELSAISENLLQGSNDLLDRANMSKNNLSELERSNADIAEQINQVNQMSKNLLDISAMNEKAMNDLMATSNDVEHSTQNTMTAMSQLQEEVGEIGKTLDIINEIADSTSLLALNASIEAARAGDAGKGFSVVALEVGKLAANTQDSLDSVHSVISRVTMGTENMAKYINESTAQMRIQNKTISQTIDNVRQMLELLSQSANAIASVAALQNQQNQIINATIDISDNIANKIVEENGQFTNITEMVQNNTAEIQTLSSQIDVLNHLVEDLNHLLEV